MDKKLFKKIQKVKQKEVRDLKRNFAPGLIRNAAFSIGTQFTSAQITLQDEEAPPLAVPLLSRFLNHPVEIENYRPFRIVRDLNRLNLTIFFVATDVQFLGGDPAHVNLIKTGRDVSAIVRDFIIAEEQIYQAKAWGADGLLLDSRFVPAGKIPFFVDTTFQMGLEPFLHIHRAEDLSSVELELLGGLLVSPEDSEELFPDGENGWLEEVQVRNIPILLVGGVESPQELQRWRKLGIRHFLLPDEWMLKDQPIQEIERILEILETGLKE